MKIAVISDIHEDLNSLEMAIEKITDASCDMIICLGDIVGYAVPYYGFQKSRNSAACLALIEQRCYVKTVGNHDLYAIKKIPVNNARFEFPGNWYGLDYKEKKARGGGKVWLYDDNELDALLSTHDKLLLENYPEYATMNVGSFTVLASHYFYPDLSGSMVHTVNRPEQAEDHFGFMKQQRCNIGFVGHDHIPGLSIYTKQQVSKYDFGAATPLPDNVVITVPCIANGDEPNGFVILDTQTLQLVAIPLGVPVHTVPAWRKR